MIDGPLDADGFGWVPAETTCHSHTAPWASCCCCTRARVMTHERLLLTGTQNRKWSLLPSWPMTSLDEQQQPVSAQTRLRGFVFLNFLHLKANGVNPAEWEQWWDYMLFFFVVSFLIWSSITSLGNNLFCLNLESFGTFLGKCVSVQQHLCCR